MAEHAFGPWFAGRSSGDQWSIGLSPSIGATMDGHDLGPSGYREGASVGDPYMLLSGFCPEESVRLILAAPDLLKAAMQMRAFLAGEHDGKVRAATAEWNGVCTDLDVAISKATSA